jgi:hypothetical protein
MQQPKKNARTHKLRCALRASLAQAGTAPLSRAYILVDNNAYNMAPRQYYVAVGTQEAKLVRVARKAARGRNHFRIAALRCVLCARRQQSLPSLTKHNQHP